MRLSSVISARRLSRGEGNDNPISRDVHITCNLAQRFLIAIISDTYREATIANRRGFGRSQNNFSSLNMSPWKFLRPGLDASDQYQRMEQYERRLFLFTNHVGRWFVLLSPSSNSHHSL
jgi:hypothetical protein